MQKVGSETEACGGAVVNTTMLPGLYVRPPFDEAIAAGLKTVETRGYPPPDKHLGKWIAILRPAMRGKPAHAVCLAWLEGWHLYMDKADWLDDFARHHVPDSDAAFNWEATEKKYGWRFDSVFVPPWHSVVVNRGGRVWTTVEVDNRLVSFRDRMPCVI